MNKELALRSEVSDILQYEDYFPFLTLTLLLILPSTIDASELRPWLFEVYTIYKDRDAYEEINIGTRNMYSFVQMALNKESLELRESIYRDHELWFNSLRSLR